MILKIKDQETSIYEPVAEFSLDVGETIIGLSHTPAIRVKCNGIPMLEISKNGIYRMNGQGPYAGKIGFPLDPDGRVREI